MSRLAMPFLILNYGAEMVFILEQRLHAQTIGKDKSVKVLFDVTKALFAQQFVNELFRPQDVYSLAATKEIFDRLSQSSAMRLSENSMEKLFDLMTMGCKHQFLCCRQPKEIIELTLNHLEALLECVQGAPNDHILSAIDNFSKWSSQLSNGQLNEIRLTLLQVFQDKRVKVSLFLQEKLQHTDGTFVLPKGNVTNNDLPLGVVRYYNNAQLVNQETFDHPDSANTLPGTTNYNPFDATMRQNKMGRNVYMSAKSSGSSREEPQSQQSTAATAVVQQRQTSQTVTADNLSGSFSSNEKSPTSTPSLGRNTSFRARQQGSPSGTNSGGANAMNSLSQLIGVSQVPNPVRLNLFPDQSQGSGDGASGGSDVIVIGRTSREEAQRSNTELMSVIDGMSNLGPTVRAADNKSTGDDLLDLMDS